MPFWDVEFTEVYEKVPYKHRLDKKLYKEYVDQLFTNIAENPFEKPQGSANAWNSAKKKFYYTVKRILPEGIKRCLRKKRELRSYKNHPMGWYGIHDESYVREQIKSGYSTINSLIAKRLHRRF